MTRSTNPATQEDKLWCIRSSIHSTEQEYKDWMIKQVKELYGSGGEGGVGPFSVKTYMECIVTGWNCGEITLC